MMRLTREQAAIVGVYTGILCGPVADLHGAAERLLGRPIWTHEFAEPGLWERLREAAKPEFLAICALEEATQ